MPSIPIFHKSVSPSAKTACTQIERAAERNGDCSFMSIRFRTWALMSHVKKGNDFNT